MGDELRGESLVHLNVRFSTETELKAIQDMLYEKSGQGVSFTGLVEAMAHEVTIVTAIHTLLNIDGKGQAHAEAVVAKSTRPSVLDNLKRPVQPHSTDKKTKQHEEVR